MPSTKRNKIDSSTREKIVNAVMSEGQTYAQVGRRFGFPHATVRSIIVAFEEDGRLDCKPRGGNRARVIQPEHIQWLKRRLRAQEVDPTGTTADVTIKTLHRELNEHFQLKPLISVSAVTRAVRAHAAGFSLKLLMTPPSVDYNSQERIETRRIWAQTLPMDEHGSIQLTDIVFVDEAGFNLQLNRRLRRGVPKSTPPVKKERGRNLSFIVAVGREGVIASDIQLGAFNDQIYRDFFTKKLLPALASPRTIVLDSTRLSTSIDIESIITQGSHTLRPPPSNSLHFNAAGPVFKSVQSFFKSQEFQDREPPTKHLRNGLNRITPDMCLEWIQEAASSAVKAGRGDPLDLNCNRNSDDSSDDDSDDANSPTED